MFRVILAEIKKTFAKPGIYILTGILIVVLFACALLYSPKTKDSLLTTVEEDCKISATSENVTIQNMYDYFMNPLATSLDTNNRYLDNLESYRNFINFYYNAFYPESDYAKNNPGSTSTKVLLNDLIDNSTEIISNKNAFYESVTFGEVNNINSSRQALANSLNSFIEKLATVGASSDFPTVLITNSNFEDLSTLATQCYKIVNPNAQAPLTAYDAKLQLESMNLNNKMSSYLGKIKEFKPSEDVLSAAVDCLDEVEDRIDGTGNNDILLNIKNYAIENGAKKDKAAKLEFNTLITKYKSLIKEINVIIHNSLYVDVFKSMSANQIHNYKGFDNINFYEISENLAKNEYLFNTETYEFEYATVLNINQSSNDYINAYDFSTFALRLCSFIIIIYCIVLAAGSIAGEQQAGTLKLLAIRPYSRRKLMEGKISSTLLIGFGLLVISAVATLIAGLITYTGASAPVLMVANAEMVLVVPVIIEYFFMILSMMFELAFFVVIAYGISTIFKSNVGAVAISIMIYFGSLILNTLAVNYSILRFLPFTNINLFKYMGGSFLSHTNGFLSAVLTPSVVVGSNLIFSVLFSGLFMVGVYIATMIVFKKRDIK